MRHEELSGDSAVRLDLRAARLIIDRGLTRAYGFGVRGTFAICDDAGVLISLSRMQGASAAGVHITRGKAVLAAVHQERSDAVDRRIRDSPARFHAVAAPYPGIYPGSGAHYIKFDGRVIGAYASGSGYGPLRRISGVDQERLMADGEPANVEDLITSYALGIPYRDQHPGTNLVERSQGELHEWNVGGVAFEGDSSETWAGFGQRRPSLSLRTARVLADAVVAHALERREAVSVAICDEVGTVMQIDRVVDASPASVTRAEERAKTCFAERVDGGDAALLRTGDGGLLGSIGVAGDTSDSAMGEFIDAAVAALR
jgi:uncharacterized protein GlcG (DUF336 family)